MNNQQRILITRLIKLFNPFKLQLTFIVISLIIYTSISLSIPLLNKSLIDNGILAYNFKHVVILSSILFVLFLINGINDFIKEKTRSKIASNIQQNLMEEAFNSILHVNICFFNSKNNTEILNDIMLDVKSILRICDSNVFFVITQLLSFVGGITGLLIIDYRLALLVLIFIPTKFLLVKHFGNKRKLLVEKIMEANNKFAHWFGDTLSGIKEIRLFCIQQIKSKEQRHNISNLAESERKMTILDAINSSSDIIMMQFMECTLYIAGAYFIFEKTLTVGSLFAFITYAMQVIDPISNVLNIKYILTGILPSAQRYFNFIDESYINKELDGKNNISTITSLKFKDVSFSYDKNNILKDINFNINSGEKVAIIGKNGVGKSTIFNLIQRFILPDTGTIYVNDTDIQTIKLNSYRDNLCCINQNNHLFDMNIIDNIKLYNNMDYSLLNSALVQSGTQDILHDERNFFKPVGQDGGMLSGGQKQKIILARLLAKKASLYLLDEATANLDYKSEFKIFHMLHTHFKKNIIIFIIHKQEFLQYMDKIILLANNGSTIIFNSYLEFKKSNFNNEHIFDSQNL